MTEHGKISVHCAVGSVVAIVVSSQVGVGVPVWVLLPALAWSRTKLGRHTLAQTVAGTALGIMVGLLSLVFASEMSFYAHRHIL